MANPMGPQPEDTLTLMIVPGQAGRCKPFPAGPPSGGGKQERQPALETDLQILSHDFLKRRAFWFVIDETRVDDKGVELKAAVAP